MMIIVLMVDGDAKQLPTLGVGHSLSVLVLVSKRMMGIALKPYS